MAGKVKRGNIVTVSAAGDYAKPRPAVILQSDWLTGTESVLVALMTSTIVAAPLFRVSVQATETNGLKADSQFMIDKILAVPRAKCGYGIGTLDESSVIALNHMLSVVIGLAD